MKNFAMRREIVVLYFEEDLTAVSEVALAFREIALASGGKIKLRHVAFWEDAADMLQSGSVDVLLFGISENSEDVFERLATIKEKYPNLPVLATGSNLALELVKRVVKSGAKLYLPQPLKPRRVAAIIASCVEQV